MFQNLNNLLSSISEKAGWELGFVTENDLKDKQVRLSPFKKQLAKLALKDANLAVDAIYFSGENPFIQFKTLNSFDIEKISELHRKIWNEGRTPLLGIITPAEVRFYDSFDIPGNDEKALNKLERARFQTTEQDLNKLANLLHQSKIDSGLIWKESFGKNIKTQSRVDRTLVANMAATREKLFTEYKFPFDIIHDLLGRSLFTLYLEDRGILTPENYPSKPRGVSGFFDLLNYPESTYKLFHYLKTRFNGDIFPVSAKEEKLVNANPAVLEIIRNCFSGEMDVQSGQLNLIWRLFQFQYIPIELISSIYEEFMSEEDENHEKIKKEGAFYTPQMLVEFVLNEVLPWPDENNKNYNLKILDPACGSGIFLVESYKRLIARWKYSNKGKDIDENVLEDLLINNIYGIEKDAEAVKVTAFSLYLTFLNYIEPKKALSQVKFKQLIRWKDKKELELRENKKPGNNLFQFSTFTKDLDVFQNKFDLIVGNPPWKLGKLDNDVKTYLNKHKLPQQIMCAYLDFMPELVNTGTIALISAAKILFNTGDLYDEFRAKFFKNNIVDAVINLAVVRDIMFKNASSPGAVFIYKKKTQQAEQKDYVTYCIPKSTEIIKHRQTVVIDASEVKFIPLREILKPNSKVFKIAMWGNARDLKLIEKLQKIVSIKDIADKKEIGGGLHLKEKGKKAGNEHLANNYFVSPDKIQQYYIPKTGISKLGSQHTAYRPNTHEVFNKPVVLINEGSKGSEFCCSFIDYNCVYKSSSYGISLKNKSDNFHKALVASLNSTIASYYFFITSSSWGIDKGGRVQNNDAVSFPALPTVMDDETIDELAAEIDKIIKLYTSNEVELHFEDEIKKIKHQIDQIIYNVLKLSSIEKALVNDVMNYSSALHNRYIASKAECPAKISTDIKSYSQTFIKAVNSVLKYSQKEVGVNVFDTGNTHDLINILEIKVYETEQGKELVKIIENKDISKILKEINAHTYEEHSESVYYRKVIKYFSGNSIYFVKPNQKRFWSTAQALNDADNFVLDILSNK